MLIEAIIEGEKVSININAIDAVYSVKYSEHDINSRAAAMASGKQPLERSKVLLRCGKIAEVRLSAHQINQMLVSPQTTTSA